MSEKDIRAAIRQVCSDLDGCSRSQTTAATVGKVVLPLVLGAGLVGSACSSDVDEEGQGGATTTQAGTQSGTSSGTAAGTTTGTGTGAGEPMPAYGVPGGGVPWGGSGGVGGQGGATGGGTTGGGGAG